MDAPAAISGTFVRIEPVATRKVIRLHIECPIEAADQILAALGGYPDPANPKHVAIAQLNEAPAAQSAGAKWAPDKSFSVKQVVLTCQKEEFWMFLQEKQLARINGEEDAARYVRSFCKVESRSEIGTNPQARERWHFLLSAFNAWTSGAAA